MATKKKPERNFEIRIDWFDRLNDTLHTDEQLVPKLNVLARPHSGRSKCKDYAEYYARQGFWMPGNRFVPPSAIVAARVKLVKET